MADQHAGNVPSESISLPDNIEMADTAWKRAIGLMFRRKATPLLIEFDWGARHAIWMLFMRFPIDLVFLDVHMTVITVYEGIPPLSLNPRSWRIYRPKRAATYALETPAGWVKNNSVTPGMQLTR